MKSLFRWATIYAGALLLALPSPAQTFTTLKNLGDESTSRYPASPLVQGEDGTLYGTTADGDEDSMTVLIGPGTVFKVQPDGSGFTVLKWLTNSMDGKHPLGVLTLSNGVLYGTTSTGGDSGGGTVFKIGIEGMDYAVLKSFNGSDGSNPQGGLLLSSNVLYGATQSGGDSGNGVLFKINVDGTGYGVLKNFTDPNDGAEPNGGLVFSNNVLYGTLSGGGRSNAGTIFKINTDGTGFTQLKNFADSDGVQPNGGLAFSSNVLYGTTAYGGSTGCGIVFKINIDGTGYTVIKDYTCDDDNGGWPNGELTVSGNVLYGTTAYGGSSGVGTVFRLNTDGTGYAVLKSFTNRDDAYPDGAYPNGGLALSGSTLYGTTIIGGGSSGGTVFKINTDGTGGVMLKEFAESVDGTFPAGPLTLSDHVLYGTAGFIHASVGTVFKINVDGSGFVVLNNDFTSVAGEFPFGPLTLSSNVLYGTTEDYGGTGTIFKMNTDGTDYIMVKQFTNSVEGVLPSGGLAVSGGVIYGTTIYGGSSNLGTVFRINIDGTDFAVLKSFTDAAEGEAYPSGSLTLSNDVLYGTSGYRDNSSWETVFRINTDGAGYTVLKRFTNSVEGTGLSGGLALSGGVLYGTTYWDGSGNYGTVFRINTNGTDFAVLKDFANAAEGAAHPTGPLTLSGTVLYGTSGYRDNSNWETVFKINTDGTGYLLLKRFTNYMEGAGLYGGLALSDSILYGTTFWGGSRNYGTVFSINLNEVPLNWQMANSALILDWANPALTLQSASSIAREFTDVPGAASPHTNALTGPQQFFRLKSH